MKYFVFRNTTIEPLFKQMEVSFSGYDDISFIDVDSDIYIWFYILPYQHDPKIQISQIDFFYKNLEMVYKRVPDNKLFCVFALFNPFSSPIEIGNYSVFKAINDYNSKIIKFSEDRSNVKIINVSDFILNNQKEEIIDWKYYFISKMLINPKLSKNFNSWFQSQMDAVLMKRMKCVVLDLDNTLWGGILGEDGIEGIKIGGDYPGSAFMEFQKGLLELKSTGIILTICSKNNESDVIEAWKKNPNLIIKKEHVTTYRINWENKADNIKEIAAELNIGLDSIVFIDDNPTERELIRQVLPMVMTPDFPLHPYQLPVFLSRLIKEYFRIYKITQEDLTKTEQYKSNAEREVFKSEFKEFNQYLESLEIKIGVQKANTFNIQRIAQMTQKTNQFNLTTYRYTEGDIKEYLDKGDWVYCIDVKDRFGESGITGLIIVEVDMQKKSSKINSLLLSCRILGKGIEDVFVYFILNKLKSDGFKKVYAKYISTAKNEQVKDFYDRIGFVNLNINEEQTSVKEYFLELDNFKFKTNAIYKIEES